MSGRLRCKFYVPTVEHSVGAELVTATAVYGKDGTDNGQWSKATPVGKLTMTITNEEAWGILKPGDYIYIDIQVVEPEPAAPAEIGQPNS